MSFAADDDSGVIGGLGSGGFRSRLRCWAAPQDHGESNGGAGRVGEVMFATSGTGGRRRPNWPETGKKAPHCRLLAVGALLGCKEVASLQGRARGLLFIGVEVGSRGGRG